MYLCAKFKNNAFEQDFCNKGYLYIPDFLSPDRMKELLSLYKSLHTDLTVDAGMWNSLYNLNKEDSTRVSNRILSILRPELDNILENYAAPVASFMSKNANNLGICDLHRDFSILDETRFEYRNVWVPLVDINIDNGALYALPGSHRLFNYPLPMFCKWPYTNLQNSLFKKVEIFNVKAGDLVVYADRTLHGSFLNRSTKSRPVVHMGILHPDYELAYYFMDSENFVKVFSVPYSFYLENKFGDQEGRYPLIKTYKFEPPAVEYL